MEQEEYFVSNLLRLKLWRNLDKDLEANDELKDSAASPSYPICTRKKKRKIYKTLKLYIFFFLLP